MVGVERGKCPTPCKKGGKIPREGEMSGGRGICPWWKCLDPIWSETHKHSSSVKFVSMRPSVQFGNPRKKLKENLSLQHLQNAIFR